MNYKLLLPACLLLFNMKSYAQKSITTSNTISLNGTWQFQTDSAGIGEDQHWYAEHRKAFTDKLTVPGNWNIENRYAAYTGKGWYKITVFVPAALNGQLIRLYFEGVYNAAKVWVNGQFVTENNLGYLQFEKDISSLLHYGKKNTIVVCADNHFKLGALWNWGGIRRPVKLLINDPLYIAQNHVTPRVNLSAHTAQVIFDVSLSNTSRRRAVVSGRVDVSFKGQLLKSVPIKTNIGASQNEKLQLSINLAQNNFKLWSLDDPNLYDYKLTLFKGSAAIDTFDGHFGLRVIELNKADKQLKLNGKVIRPIGFNLVPDDRTTGNSLPLWRVKEDIDLMKSLGAGVARMSHMPFHQELLDYLDEKGMLIFEEIPVWGNDNSMVKVNNPVTNEWLKRMINDHYNHPCIAGWSVGNEIGKNKEVMAYTEAAIKLVKQLDTTRMGVTVSYTGQNPVDPLQLSDIGFMNAYGRTIHRAADRIHAVHKESTLFLSEFGLGQLNEDLTADFPIKNMMDSLRMKPFLIGASLWTFNDYRSTYKDTKEPSQNRPWGLVDVARQKKAAFYSFRNANKPVASFEVKMVRPATTINGLKVAVAITPRAVYDLPAYELDGYRVVLKLLDRKDNVIGGDYSFLPEVHPCDQPFSVSLNAFKTSVSMFKANVSLVSRQNYTVYDTVIYFQKPIKTKILYAASGLKQIGKTFPNKRMIQVVYEKDNSATGYKLRYHTATGVKETPLTIAHYINVTDSDAGDFSNAELIAVNSVGETVSPLPPFSKTDGLLPPVIRYTEAADKAFFIEPETAVDDQQFIVQTTERAGYYAHASTTTAEIKGSLKVSGLINGKPYYYHIRHVASTGEESGWSEEVTVKPDGGLPPAKPVAQGIILGKSGAILCFQPVKKATGYDLFFRAGTEQTWHHEQITSSQIDQYVLQVQQKTKNLQVRLATINQYGTSAYTLFSVGDR